MRPAMPERKKRANTARRLDIRIDSSLSGYDRRVVHTRIRIPILLAVLVLPWPAFAFKGRVVDQQGRPVAHATISVLGRPGEAITDADGRFEWRPDPPPPFEILVI